MKKSLKFQITQFFIWTYLFVGATGFTCSAQDRNSAYNNWTYKNLPDSYSGNSSGDLSQYQTKVDAISSQAYDLTNSLPAGYNKDGTVDYTKYIQAGINNNKIVIFPNFPILVNSKGLSLISDSKVIFRKKSKLILQANALATYQILRIYGVNNVVLYFPVIQGDRKVHTGAVGQWGMGLSICGSTNVLVVNPKISDCWGDGIYIGRLSSGINRNVTICNASLDNNRRNGLSIVCADGLTIKKATISNTGGQMPMSGIDIEPNTNDDVIKNVKIDNVITYNNAMHGIVVSLSGLVGDHPQEVSVDIDNHIDDSSSIGFGMSLTRSDKNKGLPLSGQLNVINSIWKNDRKKGFQNYKGPYNGVNVTFKKLSILKKDSRGGLSIDDSGISEMRTSLGADRKITIQQ